MVELILKRLFDTSNDDHHHHLETIFKSHCFYFGLACAYLKQVALEDKQFGYKWRFIAIKHFNTMPKTEICELIKIGFYILGDHIVSFYSYFLILALIKHFVSVILCHMTKTCGTNGDKAL